MRRPLPRRLPDIRVVLSSAALLVALAPGALAGPTPEEIREILAAQHAHHSSDGLVTVTSPADISGSDALAVLRFAGDVRQRLGRYLGASLDGEDSAAFIGIQSGPDDPDPRVSATVPPNGPIRVFVTIHGLGAVRPEAVTIALCRAHLRANALSAGYRDPRDRRVRIDAAPYPAWFGMGLARLLDISARQEDAEETIAAWESGTLAPIVELLAPSDGPAEQNAALAAQVVAWLFDSESRQERFQALRELASVDGWNAGRALAIASGVDDADAAQTVWESWLDARKWSVLTPGSSHPAFLRRLRSLLVLRRPETQPSADGEGPSADETDTAAIPRDFEPTQRLIPASAYGDAGEIRPETLLDAVGEPWAGHAAMALHARLQRAVAGHGDAALSAAKAYGQFFQAVREGKSREELESLLSLASDFLAVLER